MKKRADGRYCKQVVIGYDSSGKRKTKSFYGKSKREVEQRAALFKDELKKGIAVINDNITVAEWAREWLDTYKTGIAYNTLQSYRTAVEAHIIPFMGSVKLINLKKYQVQELLNNLIGEGKRSMAEYVRLSVCQMLTQAQENELIYKNVASQIKLPPKQKPLKRALTNDEKKLVRSADLSDGERMLLLVMLYAGLRRGEALALTSNDIDFENNTIHVCKTLIFKGNNPEIKQSPKSDAGNRYIPIVDIIRDDLRKYVENNHGPLFHMSDGSLVTKSSYRKTWARILKKLNEAAGGSDGNVVIADDITSHIFRHTFATSLYYAGVDLKTAQQLLGHATARMTLDIYTHLDAMHAETAYKRLNEFLGGNDA